jgi:hypothetical protein
MAESDINQTTDQDWATEISRMKVSHEYHLHVTNIARLAVWLHRPGVYSSQVPGHGGRT